MSLSSDNILLSTLLEEHRGITKLHQGIEAMRTVRSACPFRDQLYVLKVSVQFN